MQASNFDVGAHLDAIENQLNPGQASQLRAIYSEVR